MQPRNPANLKGIDIASYQAGLNFTLVKEASINIVYIKATEGLRYVNPYAQQHYHEAKAQGLKVGFYHFFWPSLDPVKQMQHFVNTIANLGLTYDCRLALDVEDTKGCSPEGVSQATVAALKELASATGHIPIVYTYTYFARKSMAPGAVSRYPLWIADYNSTGKPGLNPLWDSWVGYQYSSSGNIGGITVDLDEFTPEILLKGDDEVQKFEQQQRVKVNLYGVERTDCVLIEVEGRPTTYIPAIALRDSGDEVTWDEANHKAIIKRGGK